MRRPRLVALFTRITGLGLGPCVGNRRTAGFSLQVYFPIFKKYYIYIKSTCSAPRPPANPMMCDGFLTQVFILAQRLLRRRLQSLLQVRDLPVDECELAVES